MENFPYGLETKTITGRYQDSFYNANGEVIGSRPREGYVYITPSVDRIRIPDPAADPADPGGIKVIEIELWEHRNNILRVPMIDGVFEVELLVTEQSKMQPSGWTYNIKPSWKEEAAINIPITADLDDIVDINQYYELPAESGSIVIRGDDGTDGDDGRGIVSMEVEPGGTVALIRYTDGTTSELILPIIGAGGQTVKLNHVHEQNNPEQEWFVQHDMNRSISSVRVDFETEGGNGWNDLILCPWKEIDLNSIVIYVTDSTPGPFGTAASGRAIVA